MDFKFHMKQPSLDFVGIVETALHS